jgi:hypothetical protein
VKQQKNRLLVISTAFFKGLPFPVAFLHSVKKRINRTPFSSRGVRKEKKDHCYLKKLSNSIS